MDNLRYRYHGELTCARTNVHTPSDFVEKYRKGLIDYDSTIKDITVYFISSRNNAAMPPKKPSFIVSIFIRLLITKQ